MANSRFRHEVEAWIREEFLCEEFGQPFKKKQLRLTPGGKFEFDAASQDGRIAVNISTASARTRRSGKLAHGSINKVRGDILFLTLAETLHKILVLTEPDMHRFWVNETKAGRVPKEVRFMLVELPETMRSALDVEKRLASEEIQHRPIG
jgi:hypothetical protein